MNVLAYGEILTRLDPLHDRARDARVAGLGGRWVEISDASTSASGRLNQLISGAARATDKSEYRHRRDACEPSHWLFSLSE
jgi:hypothetical protein